MKALKAIVMVTLLVGLAMVGQRLVIAASTGEDFEWFATTTYGLRIGGSGAQTPPEALTVEFVEGQEGHIAFADGQVTFVGTGIVQGTGSLIVGAADEIAPAKGAFMAATDTSLGDYQAVVIGEDTSAGLASADGWIEEDELVVDIHASLVCTPQGSVYAQLGAAPQEAKRAATLDAASIAETRKFLAPYDNALLRHR